MRLTHWGFAITFAILLVSGVAILLAHPRLYWGETGGVGGPSLIDLPLPFVLDIPIRGPGRYLHFLAAWFCVFIGAAYVAFGLLTGHFLRHLVPARGDFTMSGVRAIVAGHLRWPRRGAAVAPACRAMRYSTMSCQVVDAPLVTSSWRCPEMTSTRSGWIGTFGCVAAKLRA